MLNRKVNSGINKQEKVIETLSDAKEAHDKELDSNKLLNKIVVDENPKIDEFKGVESNIKAFDKKVDPLGDLMDKRKDKEQDNKDDKIDKLKEKNEEDWKEE